MTKHCIIIDDEPLARNILQNYLGQFSTLSLFCTCKNAQEAKAILEIQNVDLIFCDIQMPGLNGLDFLNSLKNLPKVIITSAYREYALDGFHLGVVDYLLKPISFERFSLAIYRAFGAPQKIDIVVKELNPDFLFFKTGNSFEKVFLHQICFIEAYGNYCKLHFLDNRKILIVNSKISDLEKELASKKFIRIHKSYLINQIHIQKIETNSVLLIDQNLPISESYKKNFKLKSMI